MCSVLDKERYRIELDAADGSPTVEQLAEQIFSVTKIPVSNQRLICRGKEIMCIACNVLTILRFYNFCLG